MDLCSQLCSSGQLGNQPDSLVTILYGENEQAFQTNFSHLPH